jgi:hypothetical protein
VLRLDVDGQPGQMITEGDCGSQQIELRVGASYSLGQTPATPGMGYVFDIDDIAVDVLYE